MRDARIVTLRIPPQPSLGLVISYSYLWRREHRAGQEEGRKDRPCVIVLSVRRTKGDPFTVRVAPITQLAPNEGIASMRLPATVKRNLRLDDEPSWIILDEINEFTWPGYDLRGVPHLD